MSAFFFLFNGPPKCGKSTLAREALRHFSIRQVEARSESFAGPMKQFISVLLGQPYSSISKDTYHPLLSQTPREFLIALSETYLKPKYGDTFYGRAVEHRTAFIERSVVFVIDDSGFDGEYSILPRASVCLVRVIRPGFDFAHDSRGYIQKPDRVISNDGDLSKALSVTRDAVEYSIIKWRLWKQNFNLKLDKHA